MLDDYEDKDEGDDADDGPKDLPSRRHGAPSNVERILDFISVRKPFSKQHPLLQNSVGEGDYRPYTAHPCWLEPSLLLCCYRMMLLVLLPPTPRRRR